MRGELLLKTVEGSPSTADTTKTHDEADRCFRDAIAQAHQMGAKLGELRATTSLSRLFQSQGRPVEARGLLAPLYASFTQARVTRDLREAKLLLDELDRGR